LDRVDSCRKLEDAQETHLEYSLEPSPTPSTGGDHEVNCLYSLTPASILDFKPSASPSNSLPSIANEVRTYHPNRRERNNNCVKL